MENRPMNVLGGSQNVHVEQLYAYQVDGSFHLHTAQLSAEHRSLFELLQPITDASHTRDRRRSPPDSACMHGTRLEVVKNVTTWAKSDISSDTEPHVCLMHGYVGCGKSAISQEVCETSKREGRPVASFFFFRNAGDRSKIWRLATTLASQMAAAIPETEPFIRTAVRGNPALLRPEEARVSLGTQMHHLVYAPFKAAVQGDCMARTPTQGSFGDRMWRLFYGDIEPAVQRDTGVRALAGAPFLIVLDGLDECDNKDEVKELIDSMLLFFNDNPFIPLRVFITSRVEQHIQSRLNVPGVRLENLVDHCSDDDISTFLEILFKDENRRNPVIQAYVQQHGEWPTPDDRRKLVEHIGGSFIFASAVFKFIMGPNHTKGNHPTTPMERLPLALKMNPGLDGLYEQTLARSEHLPHFPNIISTIALLRAPLPTSGIAEFLGINTYEVVNVLVNLQAIIQVPGTDDIPVTLFHTSLRDFLTNKSRSSRFFADPSYHVYLFLRCLECELKLRRQRPGLLIDPSRCTPAVAYALLYSSEHLNEGQGFFKISESNSAIQLRREALELHPGIPELIDALADVIHSRARHTRSLADLEDAISLFHEALRFQPSPHPGRSRSLSNLGTALMDRSGRAATMPDLEQAISLHREALKLRPFPHPDRWQSLNSVSDALRERYRRTGTMADLEEAISLCRDTLALQPSPRPGRLPSLSSLGNVLLDRYRRTGAMADLEEAILLCRDALELCPSPHPVRFSSLNNLGNALLHGYQSTGTMADLEEAIALYREALQHCPSPHPGRSLSLNNLGNALLDRYRHTGTMADLEEAILLCCDALELCPSPHPTRSLSLNDLGNALLDRYRSTGTMADLEEAIFLFRDALELQPSPRPGRLPSLNSLGSALLHWYQFTGTMADLEEAILLCRDALELCPSPHLVRSSSLSNLGNALLGRYRSMGTMADLEEAISLYRETLQHCPSPHPGRSLSLNNLGNALLDRYRHTGTRADLEEAISLCRSALELQPSHPGRLLSLSSLGNALLDRYRCIGTMADLEEAISLYRELLKHYPSPHPSRSSPLNDLGSALLDRYQRTGSMANLEEALSFHREALELRPSPHPHLDRSFALSNISICLQKMYKETRALPHLQEAILHCEELLSSHHPFVHKYRLRTLNHLASLLQMRFDATGQEEDLARIASLETEANQMSIPVSMT